MSDGYRSEYDRRMDFWRPRLVVQRPPEVMPFHVDALAGILRNVEGAYSVYLGACTYGIYNHYVAAEAALSGNAHFTSALRRARLLIQRTISRFRSKRGCRAVEDYRLLHSRIDRLRAAWRPCWDDPVDAWGRGAALDLLEGWSDVAPGPNQSSARERRMIREERRREEDERAANERTAWNGERW